MITVAFVDQSGVCKNVAIFEDTDSAKKMKSQFLSFDLVELAEGFGVGDHYINGEWTNRVKDLQADYDALSVRYIHEKYSYDEENKIMREYLSDMNNEQYKAAFDTYNSYVAECKARAYTEVYDN